VELLVAVTQGRVIALDTRKGLQRLHGLGESAGLVLFLVRGRDDATEDEDGAIGLLVDTKGVHAVGHGQENVVHVSVVHGGSGAIGKDDVAKHGVSLRDKKTRISRIHARSFS
jgi:hypothetical protein